MPADSTKPVPDADKQAADNPLRFQHKEPPADGHEAMPETGDTETPKCATCGGALHAR